MSSIDANSCFAAVSSLKLGYFFSLYILSLICRKAREGADGRAATDVLTNS